MFYLLMIFLCQNERKGERKRRKKKEKKGKNSEKINRCSHFEQATKIHLEEC